MLLLPLSTFTMVGQIQANIGVVWVIRERACLHGPPVRRCVLCAQNGPTLKVFASVTSSLASDHRDLCHLSALSVIHPIYGNTIIMETYEEYLRNGFGSTAFLGTCS